jgi:hypothetical protein
MHSKKYSNNEYFSKKNIRINIRILPTLVTRTLAVPNVTLAVFLMFQNPLILAQTP